MPIEQEGRPGDAMEDSSRERPGKAKAETFTFDAAELEMEEPHAPHASAFANVDPKPKKFHIIRTTTFYSVKRDLAPQLTITTDSTRETIELEVANSDGSKSLVTIPRAEAGPIVSALFA